ncbi:MAG TPA: serine hydrolase domain-containing protein [Rhodothermales bacterium]|nr:serine hydrolase domain-containing protein [Rhodothermales bacterium]
MAQPDASRLVIADSVSLALLQQELTEIVRASEVPGVAVALVTRTGSVWSGGFGEAEVAEGTPVTSRTLFRVNSVSKTLTALAVLQLVKEGRLSLDAPLREVAPELTFENPWAASHPIRVVHLLEHTTGFDDLHLREYGFDKEDGSLQEALAVNPAPRIARWPPGTRMAYNNGGYAVAAYLIEQVTGEPFAAFIEREVLRPLGMHDSGFGLDRVDRAHMSMHYVGLTREEPTPYPLLIRPAGALISSVDDLVALVHTFLNRDGPLVSDSVLTRMETPRTTQAAQEGLRVGYGLGMYTAIGEGYLWHGHAGGTPSAYARYAYQPQWGVGYVVLMNGNDAEIKRRLETAIQRFLIDGQPAPMPPEVVPLSLAELAAYEGVYSQRTSNWQLTSGVERLLDVQQVRVTDGKLVLAPLLGDVPDTLITAGADRFRQPGEAEPDVVFLRGARGDVTGLRTWDADNLRAGNYERTTLLRSYAPLITLILCLLLLLSVLVVSLFRGAAALWGKRSSDQGAWARWLPALAAFTFMVAVVVLVAGVGNGDAVEILGRPSATAVGFWALMWAFAILSLGALIVTVRALFKRPETGRVVRVYAFLVALACMTLTVYLASWGFIGLQTWTY